MNTVEITPLAWERLVTAVEKVRDRLRRAAAALDEAAIPYAVIGGNAVASWVGSVDEAAIRNTQDVDILLRREDLSRATDAMSAAGFVYRHSAGVTMFLDGAEAKARDAVHVIFANEKIRAEYLHAAPDVYEARPTTTARMLDLPALLRMKLTSFRHKDITHIQDFISVGLVDATWLDRLPPDLATRLQEVLDDPEG